jgi:hypothetical protein
MMRSSRRLRHKPEKIKPQTLEWINTGFYGSRRGFMCQSKVISRIPSWTKPITLLVPSIPEPTRCTWIFEISIGGEG